MWNEFKVDVETALGMFHSDTIILAGDFNENLLDSTLNHLKNNIESFAITHLILGASSNTLLGPLSCNHAGLVKDSGTLANVCSDHCPV